MTRAIVLRPKATDDLKEIISYLLREASEKVASRFFDRVWEAIDLLPDQPLAGAAGHAPIAPELRIWGVRGFPNHLICYIPTETTIDVIRITHAARDIPRLFRSPPGPAPETL